jgi:hypothetical protein
MALETLETPTDIFQPIKVFGNLIEASLSQPNQSFNIMFVGGVLLSIDDTTTPKQKNKKNLHSTKID